MKQTVIKHAVIDTAEAKRSYPGRYFYQFVPTNLNAESFDECLLLPEEKEYFALNNGANMKVGTATIVKPGFTIKEDVPSKGPIACWRLAEKLASQIYNHVEHFNLFNGARLVTCTESVRLRF